MTDEIKMELNYFIYPKLTYPLGELPRDKRAQACWYFYTIAQRLKEIVGEHIEDQFALIEGSLWMDKRYVAQAKAVATLYALESPDEFGKFWKYVEKQAAKLGLPAPAPEYTRLIQRIIH